MNLLEQEFTLLYLVPGCTDVGLAQRPRRERIWMLNKLKETKRMEAEKLASSQAKPKGG